MQQRTQAAGEVPAHATPHDLACAQALRERAVRRVLIRARDGCKKDMDEIGAPHPYCADHPRGCRCSGWGWWQRAKRGPEVAWAHKSGQPARTLTKGTECGDATLAAAAALLGVDVAVWQGPLAHTEVAHTTVDVIEDGTWTRRVTAAAAMTKSQTLSAQTTLWIGF